MGESFRRWRSELNTKYIQKGLTPFNKFGKITPSQWEELVAQKTSPEALELSARNTELAKRNKHHHHLGPGGYYAKEEQFRKMDWEYRCEEFEGTLKELDIYEEYRIIQR